MSFQLLLRPGRILLPLLICGCTGLTNRLETESPDERIGSVSIFPASADINVGESVDFTCEAKDKRGSLLILPPTWDFRTSDPAVASLISTGTSSGGGGHVTGTSPGPAQISCLAQGGSVGATANVTVHGFTVGVTPATATIAPQASELLTAFVSDRKGSPVAVAAGSLVWTSSAPTIATVAVVSAQGARVTGVAPSPPPSVVTAQFRIGGLVGGSGSATITVAAPQLSVTVSGTTFTMAAGSSVLLTVTVRDAAGNIIATPTLTFGSNSNGQLVVLSSTATSVVVRGLTPGVYQFTVTATANGQTGSATVNLTVT